MKSSEIKLLLRLLEDLDAHYSRVGCNDFDISNVIPIDEQRDFVREVAEWNKPGSFNQDYGHIGNWASVLPDFVYLRYLKWVLRKEGLMVGGPTLLRCEKHNKAAAPLSHFCSVCLAEENTKWMRDGEAAGRYEAGEKIMAQAIQLFQIGEDDAASLLRGLARELEKIE